MPRAIAIIPAAGRSHRMGQPKLLLPWHDAAGETTTVIESTLAAWSAGGIEQRIVVVHPNDADLANICRRAGAEVIVPREPPPEMKTSVALALDHAIKNGWLTDEDLWLLAPADMPWLDPTVIQTLLAAANTSTGATPTAYIFVPTHNNKPGHPVAFRASLAPEVANLASHEGVNALLTRHTTQHIPVDSPNIHGDLDTPDDYHTARHPPSR